MTLMIEKYFLCIQVLYFVVDDSSPDVKILIIKNFEKNLATIYFYEREKNRTRSCHIAGFN